jgi:hypothetical protein
MNTPEQLVQKHVAEIKRLAVVEPVSNYIQGALQASLEIIISQNSHAREWIENAISYAQKQPTPKR